MNITKCPNLVEWVDWVILLCEKGNKPYIPDLSELRRFCKNDNFKSCPYYTTSNNASENTGFSDGAENQNNLFE